MDENNQDCSAICMSNISAEKILSCIMEQDEIWWELEGDISDECPLTRHGNLVPAIHKHFRKLGPEYCATLEQDHANDENNANTGSFKRSDPNMLHENTEQADSSVSGSLVQEHEFGGTPLSVSSSQHPQQRRQRTRHVSETLPGPSSGIPITQSYSSVILHESFRPGRSMSPRVGTPLRYSSVESLQSRGSGGIRRVSVTSRFQPVDFNIYKAASYCCNYPVLAKAQKAYDAKVSGESDHSESETRNSRHESFPVKRCDSHLSRELTRYLSAIFGARKRDHLQLQSVQQDMTTKEKEREMKKHLRYHLSLLEAKTNPYYRPEKFKSEFEHKAWQDRERREIIQHLNGVIPEQRKSNMSRRNRPLEYRELLKKVMTYDLQHLLNANYFEMSGSSASTVASAASNTSHSSADQLLSKTGRRLLEEFAARFRVSLTTQLFMYIDVLDECISEGLVRLDNIAVLKTLKAKLEELYRLVMEGRMQLMLNEEEILLNKIGNIVSRIKGLIMTLLTEWKPTTEQLKHTLTLARSCYMFYDFLVDEENAEWPGCLSNWFKDAIVDDYHSSKKPDYEATPRTVLWSVSHAVDIMRVLHNEGPGNSRFDYQSAFSEYITNFPQAVSSGLYEAVMTDIRLLAGAMMWPHSVSAWINHHDSADMRHCGVNLNCIALSYKLDEFDKLVQSDKIIHEFKNACGFTESWKILYHQLAVYWLDVLSCHMRRQVVHAVTLDDFTGPWEHSLASQQDDAVRSRSRTKCDDSAIPMATNEMSQNEVSEMNQTSFMVAGTGVDQAQIRPKEKITQDETQYIQTASRQVQIEEDEKIEEIHHLGRSAEDKKSDSDTLDGEDSSDIQTTTQALSSRNIVTDSSCVLLSYRKLDVDSSGTFYSCTTDESSGNLTKYESVLSDTTFKSLSSSFSECATPTEDPNHYDSSTCVSDTSATLPQIVQCPDIPIDPPKRDQNLLHPGSRTENKIDGVSTEEQTNATKPQKERISRARHPSATMPRSSILKPDAIQCNISSSLIDVMAVISRFSHVVRTIIDTVYTLPSTKTTPTNSDIEIFDNPEDFNRNMEAKVLGEMKERFIQKALQAICGVIQQYTNNLLSIDLSVIPKKASICLIGRRFYYHINNGKYNETILRRHYTMDSYATLQQDDTDVWKNRVARKMINRLNSLLVWKCGLSDLWAFLEKTLMPWWTRGSADQDSTASTMPSQGSVQHLPSEGNSSSEVSDQVQSRETFSSGETPSSPGTSTSACTAIFRGDASSNVSCEDGDNNNNETGVYDLKMSSCSDVTAPKRGNSDTGADYVDEEVPMPQKIMSRGHLTRTSSEEEISDEESINGIMYNEEYITPFMDFLKENVRSHVNNCVKAMSNLIAYQAREWIGPYLDAAIDCPVKSGQSPARDKLLSCLSTLLDVFSKSIHKEGVKFVEEKLWLQLMQDFKQKIIQLKEVKTGVSRQHAQHILDVSSAFIQTWYRHPSKSGGADLAWLLEPIRPSLTLLELYCLPTNSLLDMYVDCEEELLLDFELISNAAELVNCREVMLLCMRMLQDRKSFSGQLIHQTLTSIMLAKNQDITAEEAKEEAGKACQQMLEMEFLQFVFKRMSNSTREMPPLITAETSDEEKERTFSMNTGTSQESSAVTDEPDSIQEMQKNFCAHSDYFYRFSQIRLPLSIMDDIQATAQTPPDSQLSSSFLVKLLMMRSRTDKEARLFLQEHGHLPRTWTSCFCFV